MKIVCEALMGGDWPRVFYGGFQVTKWRHDAKSQLSFKSLAVSIRTGPNAQIHLGFVYLSYFHINKFTLKPIRLT